MEDTYTRIQRVVYRLYCLFSAKLSRHMRLLCRYVVTYVRSHLCPLFAKYNVSVPLEERVQDEPENFTKWAGYSSEDRMISNIIL